MNLRSQGGRAGLLSALAGIALALLLGACGGQDADSFVVDTAIAADGASSTEPANPAAPEPASTGEAAAEPAETDTAEANAAAAGAAEVAESGAVESDTAATQEPPTAAEVSSTPARPPIQLLAPDQAIANAAANINNLQRAENVLDIEVLAVADGSIQTMRDVVTGDRPVLFWFFSPH